jgi:uncharacterized damage-inducible protein DinB
MIEDLRYPIGKFQFIEPTPSLRRECIAQFRIAPGLLRQAVSGLKEEQLQSSYRSEGWTIAQVVHHLAEADANAYPRLKYALTEPIPNVMVADEARWAELPDAKSTSLAASLAMFEAIHLRWAEAWEALREEDFSRQWRHTHFGTVPLDHLLQQYAWHARHHTAQITAHRARMGW